MSKLVQLSEISRRDVLRGIALAVAAAGFGAPIDRAAAQEAEQMLHACPFLMVGTNKANRTRVRHQDAQAIA